MLDQNLKPIPIPSRQRWREFRVVWLPVITFAVLVVAIGWLWLRYVAPATIIGEVETTRSAIVSVLPGTIQEIRVGRLESVTNGQTLAVIRLLDNEQVNAEVAAAETELHLLKTRIDLDRVRNANAYVQLRVDHQLEQLYLELARINLVQAEGELQRTKKLYDDQLTARGAGIARNDYGYDVALRDRDAFRTEVATREKAVAELGSGLSGLQAAGAADLSEKDTGIELAIAAQSEYLRGLQKPIVLRSPIDGFVSVINYVPGANVTAGDIILVVSSEKSERILAWVRQPVTVRPSVGDLVKVRRSVLGDRAFQGVIVGVGKQLELINPAAVPFAPTNYVEFGLPLIVKVPENLNLLPGEAVQMHVTTRAARPSAN